jgi:tetratricopeptide (TPR) repeat protein
VSAYAQLSAHYGLAGRFEEAIHWADKTLALGGPLGRESAMVRALNARGFSRCNLGDFAGGIPDLEAGLRIALEHGLSAAGFSYPNLAEYVWLSDGPARAVAIYREGVDFAERRGLARGAAWTKMQLCWALYDLGEWDELLRLAAEAEELGLRSMSMNDLLAVLPWVHVLRGEVAEAREEFEARAAAMDTEDVQVRLIGGLSEAIVLRAEGRSDEALAVAEETLSLGGSMGMRHPFWKWTLVNAVEAAFERNDRDKVVELLGQWERMRPVERTPFLEAHRARFVARLSALRGEGRDLPGATDALLPGRGSPRAR